MNRSLDVVVSFGASVVRGTRGLRVGRLGRRPAQLLELYDLEPCPFCRLVREALTELDLAARIFPCPNGGTRFRPEVLRRGGRTQFPFLVDPNTGRELYESAEIVAYLYREYGDGPPPRAAVRRLDVASSKLASTLRARAGRVIVALPSSVPAQPLELWSFEASPYCRIAREALCELELPYVLHNVGRNSASRPAFVARSGRMMVPWLADPNTGREMFESADIVAYLHRSYGATPRRAHAMG